MVAQVLLVEDEVLLALDVAYTIECMGLEVVGPAYDLSTGLDLVESRPLDAAVLDLNLGRELSVGLADRLVERGTPFLFLTAMNRGLLPARHRGVPRLAKPCAPKVLELALSKALGGLEPSFDGCPQPC